MIKFNAVPHPPSFCLYLPCHRVILLDTQRTFRIILTVLIGFDIRPQTHESHQGSEALRFGRGTLLLRVGCSCFCFDKLWRYYSICSKIRNLFLVRKFPWILLNISLGPHLSSTNLPTLILHLTQISSPA